MLVDPPAAQMLRAIGASLLELADQLVVAVYAWREWRELDLLKPPPISLVLRRCSCAVLVLIAGRKAKERSSG